MTPEIPPGYEIVTERREGLKSWRFGEWVDVYPCDPELPLFQDEVYIAPIRLRLGENYRCRNGRETGPLVQNYARAFSTSHPFWSDALKESFMISGVHMCSQKFISDMDIVAHIPKQGKKEEKKMDKQIPISIKIDGVMIHGPVLALSELARIAQLPEVQAEVKRQEEGKRIGPGDWFQSSSGCVDRCRHNVDFLIVGNSTGYEFASKDCTKITDPAFIAMLEKGAKG